MGLTQQSVYLNGASGFIGQSLQKQLPHSLRVISLSHDDLEHIENLQFNKHSTVVHLAARVHIMRETAEDPLLEFRKVNRDITLKIARHVISQGLEKFIFLSSIAVFGRFNGGVIHDDQLPLPDDPYGQSKWEAEQELSELFSKSSGTQCVIFRLPMVYGSGNKGNMLTFLKAAAKGIPLPLKYAKGKRSLIYIKNLCDAIQKVIQDQECNRPTFQTYFLSDRKDLTSGELYSSIFQVYHGRRGVFAAPESLLRILGTIGSKLQTRSGKPLALNKEVISRLFDEYRFSCDAFCKDYQWSPPYTPEEGTRETVDWYKKWIKSEDYQNICN